MHEISGMPGRIGLVDDRFEVRIERLFPHDQRTVWHMLTRPEALPLWLAPGTIMLRVGGGVHIDFADSGTTIKSTVLALDQPRLLEYSWSSGDEPARPLRWELEPIGEGTRLTLILRLPVTEDVAKACAGFDAHLEMLAGALEGVPMRFPLDYYLARRRLYQNLQPK